MTTNATAGLLERFVRDQDADAFAVITRQYGGMVYGTCVRITGNEERAADATQETFFHLARHARQVSGSLAGWLHRVAVGKSVNQVRSDVARRRREEEYAARPRETDQWTELSPLVDEALQELEEEPREILLRHYLQGETLTNIAVEKGISQPTMSRRADQALEELREQLRRKGLLVATVLLGGFMTHTASAAPAAVLAELGKMALASSGTGAAGVGSGATSSALKPALAAAVAMVVVGVASWLLLRTNASQPHASKLAAAAGVTALPTAEELLDKYTAALDAAQSFIASYEEVCDYSYRTPGTSEATTGKKFARGQIRADGHRVYMQGYHWGDFNAQLRSLPESAARYHLRIEADGRIYVLSTAVNDPYHRGSVYSQPANRDRAVIDRDTYSGIHGFLGSEQRLDAVLRAAHRIAARPTTEKVNGSACHVMDADTQYGQYTVWLDPAHGHHAAKVTRRAHAPQTELEDVMPEGDTSTGRVEITRFEQIEGVWLPMDSTQETAYAAPGRRFHRREICRFRRTRITLNPDHERLGSFDDPLVHPANDPELKDGDRVTLGGPIHARGFWQNGKVVSEDGEVLFDGGLMKPNPRNAGSPRATRPE